MTTVDVDRFPYLCVSKWNDDEVEFVDSCGSSSPMHKLSYAEVVRSGSPVIIDSPSITATNNQEADNSQQIPLLLKTARSFKCNVCLRTFVSKRSVHTHCSKMHKKCDRTTFQCVSTESMFDSISKKSAASKQSAVSFACALCSKSCLLYTSPSPRDRTRSRMPSSA